jgi:hypothetical protein
MAKDMQPEKVVRDGKVAVLISRGFGAGWSTWADDGRAEMLLFDRRFVEAAEAGIKDVDPILEAVFGDDSTYSGGWRDIEIVWLPVGRQFRIDEYDGSESLALIENVHFYTA